MSETAIPDPDSVLSPMDPLSAVIRWRRSGQSSALATVLETWGSSPRQPGSQLAVSEAGEFVGSVSGGCVEGAVIQEARDIMAGSLPPRTLEFGVSDEEAWSVGLACGGKVSIYVENVVDEAPIARLLEDRQAGKAAVVATRLQDGRHWYLHPLEEGSREGSEELLRSARSAVLNDRSGVADVPEGEVFLQVHNPPLRLVVVGAVHITQHLVRMAAATGFQVTVIDPRRAFATELRLPDVRLIQGWPDAELPSLEMDHRTALVTLSHDPKLDDPALAVALRSPVFYVGALGSRRTHAKRVERLLASGLDDATVGRIHAPVGLDIGATTPGEIAVAVMAQIVGALRRPSEGASSV